ncbi:MAG: thioredoxin-dependent thiol peroxidase [Verrucomicrobiota bacterium]
MSEISAGDKAPTFSGPTQNGTTVKLGDFKGKHLALFFYPKDSTPGCTKQACAFRDHFAELTERGVAVVGVSVDPVASHEKFAAKFELPYPLIADEDKKIVEAYGVWKEKSMYGNKYMGTERSCFLIGPDGKVLEAWRKVPPAKNVPLLLKALEAA